MGRERGDHGIGTHRSTPHVNLYKLAQGRSGGYRQSRRQQLGNGPLEASSETRPHAPIEVGFKAVPDLHRWYQALPAPSARNDLHRRTTLA